MQHTKDVERSKTRSGCTFLDRYIPAENAGVNSSTGAVGRADAGGIYQLISKILDGRIESSGRRGRRQFNIEFLQSFIDIPNFPFLSLRLCTKLVTNSIRGGSQHRFE